MFNHVVMWKLDPSYSSREKTQHAHTIKNALIRLPQTITELKYLDVGINELDSDRSADIILITQFDNKDALEQYQNHPDHQAVIPIIKQLTSEAWAIDYTK